jgi:hypothetical protein
MALADIRTRICLAEVGRESRIEGGEAQAARPGKLQPERQQRRLDVAVARRIEIQRRPGDAFPGRHVRPDGMFVRGDALELAVERRFALAAHAIPREHAVFVRILRRQQRFAEPLPRVVPVGEDPVRREVPLSVGGSQRYSPRLVRARPLSHSLTDAAIQPDAVARIDGDSLG